MSSVGHFKFKRTLPGQSPSDAKSGYVASMLADHRPKSRRGKVVLATFGAGSDPDLDARVEARLKSRGAGDAGA